MFAEGVVTKKSFYFSFLVTPVISGGMLSRDTEVVSLNESFRAYIYIIDAGLYNALCRSGQVSSSQVSVRSSCVSASRCLVTFLSDRVGGRMFFCNLLSAILGHRFSEIYFTKP